MTASLLPPASTSMATSSVVVMDISLLSSGWLRTGGRGCERMDADGVELELGGRGQCGAGQCRRRTAVGDRHLESLRRFGACDVGAQVAGERAVARTDGAARRDRSRRRHPAANAVDEYRTCRAERDEHCTDAVVEQAFGRRHHRLGIACRGGILEVVGGCADEAGELL